MENWASPGHTWGQKDYPGLKYPVSGDKSDFWFCLTWIQQTYITPYYYYSQFPDIRCQAHRNLRVEWQW